MRIGLVLDGQAVDDGGTQLRRLASAVEAAGLDLVWLRQDTALPDPLVAATTVGTATTGLRVGVEVELGNAHPVAVAEAAAVADLSTGGRLVLGCRASNGTSDEAFREALELVIRSHRPRPFRHAGGAWPTPARLAENRFTDATAVRVTPAPAQFELPTWVVGDVAAATALGLSPVLADDSTGDEAWTQIDAAMPGPALRMSRPGLVTVPVEGGRVDHVATVAALAGARDGWGMDTALLELPPDLDAAGCERAVDVLGRVVRPRVQHDDLAPGLLDWWNQELLET